MDWIKKLKVGDKTWRTSRPDRRTAVTLHEIVVIKVGRKYITFNDADSKYLFEYTYDMNTGNEKGEGYYHTKLVESPEAYREQELAKKLFGQLRHKLGYNVSDSVTSQNVRDAAALLNIKLED